MSDATQIGPEMNEHYRGRSMMFIGLAVACVGLSMSVQMGANYNFVVNELHADGFRAGLLECVRESCGITALGLLALLAGLAEPLVACLMLVLFSVGIAGYSVVPSYYWALPVSVIWSQGLHVWMPLPNSMTLAVAEPGRSGFRLGQINTAGAVGMGVGLTASILLLLAGKQGWLPGVSLRSLYILAGVAGLAGAAACLGVPRKIKTPRTALIFRRRYALYYCLCFFEGWRKQIFLCFAGYLLAFSYKVDLLTMMLLQVPVQLLSYFLAPRVGKLIDTAGERRVLRSYYTMMIGVFLAYAIIPNLGAVGLHLPQAAVIAVLCVFFVLDGTFFLFSMGLTTYVNHIAPPHERTATLSAGVAMNHVAACTLPLLTGLVWQYFGPAYSFLLGCVAAGCSLFVTSKLPGKLLAQPQSESQTRQATEAGK